MSARATFEAKSSGEPELNWHQAVAANRISNANPLNDTEDSTFRDSLQAHFDRPDSESATSAAAEAEAASSSSPLPPPSISADVTVEKGGRVEPVSNKLNKNSSPRLVTPAPEQKQSSDVRGIRSTTGMTTGSTRKSVLDESTTTKASVLITEPDLIATLDLNAAGLAPIQPGPTVSTTSVLSDSNENIPTILNFSNSSTVAKASASLSANPQQSVAPAADSAAWPGSSGGPHSIGAGNDMTVGYRTDAPTFQRIESEMSSSEQDDSTRKNPGTHANEEARQSETPANVVSSVGSGEDTKDAGTEVDTRTDTSVESSSRTNDTQALAISQLQSVNKVQNPIPMAARKTNENGELAQAPSEMPVQSIRDLNNPVKSQRPLRSAWSANAADLSRTPKPFLSRSSSSDNRALSSNQVQPNSPSFISAHGPNVSPVAEGTTSGSTPPKITDMISSDSRLQDTFAALEPGTKNETGAYNWTRTGHMQAEAGYQDPALGWIGIRAEASRGSVHATLLPQSSDAAQELGGHIAGLHTYLAENHTPVATLTLASIGAHGQHSPGQDTGQGMHQGAGQNSERSNNTEPVPQLHSTTRPTLGNLTGDASHSDDAFIQRTSSVGFGGAHISVMA